MSEWIPVTERLPIQEGEYLVTVNNIGGRPFRSIVRWANNLYNVDRYDFPFAKRKGWYYYDSEWGYCEETDVIAWMPLPEPYKESEE